MQLSMYSTILEIYENEQGRAVLNKYMPKLTRTPSFQMHYAMTFRAVSRCYQWKLTRRQLEEANRELNEIHT